MSLLRFLTDNNIITLILRFTIAVKISVISRVLKFTNDISATISQNQQFMKYVKTATINYYKNTTLFISKQQWYYLINNYKILTNKSPLSSKISTFVSYTFTHSFSSLLRNAIMANLSVAPKNRSSVSQQ